MINVELLLEFILHLLKHLDDFRLFLLKQVQDFESFLKVLH